MSKDLRDWKILGLIKQLEQNVGTRESGGNAWTLVQITLMLKALSSAHARS